MPPYIVLLIFVVVLPWLGFESGSPWTQRLSLDKFISLLDYETVLGALVLVLLLEFKFSIKSIGT